MSRHDAFKTSRSPRFPPRFMSAAGSTGIVAAAAAGGLGGAATASASEVPEADSRVPPELVFDRGLSDLFVIRTGAQTLAQTKLAVCRLKEDHLLRELIVSDGLKIGGGRYDLDTGRVQIIA